MSRSDEMTLGRKRERVVPVGPKLFKAGEAEIAAYLRPTNQPDYVSRQSTTICLIARQISDIMAYHLDYTVSSK